MSSVYVTEPWKLSLAHVINAQDMTVPKRFVYYSTDQYAPLVDMEIDKTRCLGEFACEAESIVVNRLTLIGQTFDMRVFVHVRGGCVEFDVRKIRCNSDKNMRLSQQFFNDHMGTGSLHRLTVDSRLIDRGEMTLAVRFKAPDGTYVDCYLRCQRRRT
jgi:hypothetical protein